jgi:hypothetical protein
MDATKLEAIATAFRRTAYNAYICTLIGNAPGIVIKAGNRMKNPVPGDWVIETSTIGGFRGKAMTDLDAIGVLDAIEWEPVDFGDPDFVWDEAVEGRPHPKERVYYILTMDGRRFRWVNANFVTAVTDFPL